MIALLLAAAAIAASPPGEHVPTFDIWASYYVDRLEMRLPIPDRTALAMTRMYRQATALGGNDLTADILAAPHEPVWQRCGVSVAFYRDVLASYGYTARRVGFWYYSRTDHHSTHLAVEITGPGIERPMFYDPLYGVWLERDGVRVGVAEAILAADAQDFRTGTVAVQPVRVEPYQPALSPMFETFNAQKYYPRLYPVYWNAVVYHAPSGWVFLLRDDRYIDADRVRETFGGRRGISIYGRLP
jgi:hypothetical protein